MSLLAYKDGSFADLATVYSNGYISNDEISTIAIFHRKHEALSSAE